MIFENVYILAFDIEEANTLIYDLSLSVKIAEQLRNSKFLGFIKGKETLEFDDGVKLLSVKANVSDETPLTLVGRINIENEKLPNEYKNFFQNAWRFVIFSSNNKIENKKVLDCEIVGYGIEIIGG